MSDLYSIYEDSLNIILRNINRIIDSIKNLSKEKTENALNEAHNNLKEADRVVNKQYINSLAEADGTRSGVREEQYDTTYHFKQSNISHNNQFRYSQNEVEEAKSKFLKLQDDYINKKSQDALMILDYIDASATRKLQGKRLISNEDRFEALEQSSKSSKAYNDDDNDTQRNRNDEVFHNTNDSSSLMSQLGRKVNRNCIIAVFILLLVLIISIALCFIFL